MLLSQTSAYAVRAAIHLAECQRDNLAVGQIAEALDLPRNYLSKILHQLTRAGVLFSERGPGGGFRLAAAPDEICLADIVRAAEPQRVDRRCLLGRPECSDADPCPAHESWSALADEITSFLRDTTLADLQRRSRRTKSRKVRPRRGGRQSQMGGAS